MAQTHQNICASSAPAEGIVSLDKEDAEGIVSLDKEDKFELRDPHCSPAIIYSSAVKEAPSTLWSVEAKRALSPVSPFILYEENDEIAQKLPLQALGRLDLFLSVMGQ